ncbi:GRAB protein, partial [Erpornis zantholeuca]|nr:GRAB protein [Erpornis zantholeuca]
LLLTSAFVLLPWAGAERIIGGQEVRPHSRPYMAYLKIRSGSRTSSCGGFLIRPDAVLSAAHCVDEGGKITVILGAHNIKKRERSQQRFNVTHWVIHPDYSPDGFQNDIVLLKLEPRARIKKEVQILSLPRRNEHVIEGAKCNVSGWGWTSVTGRRTNVLREVQLKVQNEKICRQFPKYQRRSMICAGVERARKAAYHGDSGGPLVCRGKAHGIVSHGFERRLFPKVFTRISYFEPWIHEELRRFALQELPGSP